MTADEAALWRAVLDRPDDDLARLVYADYVEEHGRGPLAGFIRAQIRLANAPPGHPDHADAVEAQSLAVAAARGASSLPAPDLPAGAHFGGNISEVESDGYGCYRRGFPDAVVFNGHRNYPGQPAFLRVFGRVLTTTTVRRVEFHDLPGPAVAAALDTPTTDRLIGLTLAGRHIADQVAAMAWSRHTRGLEQLNVSGPAHAFIGLPLAEPRFDRIRDLTLGNLEQAGALAFPALAGAAWSPGLTALTLDARDGAAVEALLPALGPDLARLTLTGARRPTDVTLATIQRTQLPGLKSLEFTGVTIDEGVGRALARWELPPLAAFRLARATVTVPGLAALLRAPWLAELRELAVTDSQTPPLPEALAVSPVAAGLRLLYLDGSVSTPDEFAPFTRPGAFPRLTTLSVRGPAGAPLGAPGADGSAWPALHTLVLSDWRVTAGVAARLARCPALAGLRRLKLRGCRLGDAAAAALLGSPHLAGLVELDLGMNHLADRAAGAFLAGALPRLALADLGGNRLPPDARARLRAARPGVWA